MILLRNHLDDATIASLPRGTLTRVQSSNVPQQPDWSSCKYSRCCPRMLRRLPRHLSKEATCSWILAKREEAGLKPSADFSMEVTCVSPAGLLSVASVDPLVSVVGTAGAECGSPSIVA